MSKVYFTKQISADGIIAVYNALGRKAEGKVAVKLSMGEPGGNHFLSPAMIAPLVQSVNGTFVDSNTAYGGKRDDTASHLQAAEAHGFTAVAPVDILDTDGEISLPVPQGKHIQEDFVGSRFENYDFHLILSHFKGHAMGGFGGAVKNISIGYASSRGKLHIHNAGAVADGFVGQQNDFLESMAEAAKAVADAVGERILYINVMNLLSVDCDCDSHPAPPEMADIGVLASLDPVALDKACVDLVYAAPDSAALQERIESRNGMLTLTHAAELGLGSLDYELISLD